MKKFLIIFCLVTLFVNIQCAFSQEKASKIRAYEFVNAVMKGNASVVKSYIEAGASPNKTFMGSTPLVFAIDKKQDEILDLLLENGADPNYEAGTPALYYAVLEKNKYATARLLKAGANVDKKYVGLTAKELAKTYKKDDILDIFYKYSQDSEKFNPDEYRNSVLANTENKNIKENKIKQKEVENKNLASNQEKTTTLSAQIVFELNKKDTNLINIEKTKAPNVKTYNQKIAKDHLEYQKHKKDLTSEQYNLFVILDKILRANKLQYQNWRIGLDIDTEDLNAYAGSANLIIINTSLYDSLYDNQDALAFIVAHELAHLLLKHNQITLENNVRIQNINMQINKAQAESQKQLYLSDINNAYGDYGSAIGNSISSLAYSVSVAALNAEINQIYAQERELEIVADTEAIVLMTRAGYDPVKSKDTIELLSNLPNIFTKRSTHPDHYTRFNNINENIFLNDNTELKNQGKKEILNSKISPLKKSSDKKTIILSKGQNYSKYKYTPISKETKLINKAYSYYLDDNYVNAKDLFEKAYMVNPNNYIAPLYLSYICEYEFKQNQMKKSLKQAKRWMKKAYNNNPDSQYSQRQKKDIEEIFLVLKQEKKNRKK